MDKTQIPQELLTAVLAADAASTPVEQQLPLETKIQFLADDQHTTVDAAAGFYFFETNQDAADWFVISMIEQFKASGRLSAKQWDCIASAYLRATMLSKVEDGRYVVAGQMYEVRRTWGRPELRKVEGRRTAFVNRNEEPGVIAALASMTPEQRNAERSAFGRQTGICGCCGRDLTDPTSVRIGIGPECRAKHGISDPAEMQLALG